MANDQFTFTCPAFYVSLMSNCPIQGFSFGGFRNPKATSLARPQNMGTAYMFRTNSDGDGDSGHDSDG